MGVSIERAHRGQPIDTLGTHDTVAKTGKLDSRISLESESVLHDIDREGLCNVSGAGPPSGSQSSAKSRMSLSQLLCHIFSDT